MDNDFKLANDPDTSKEILMELSMSKYEHIRASVAVNINTPLSVVEALKKDKSIYVRNTLSTRKDK